ncbi:MAG: TRIC cation channel family protein [Polyangiaceae bacterium]
MIAFPTRGVDELWAAAGVAFRGFDVVATFLWAASGAVLGARRGFDLTGTFVIALVSSCGGGLLRDALFLQAGPPALVRTPTYVLVTVVATLLTWLLGERRRGRLPWLLVRLTGLADAIGLGAFAVVGMRLALAASISLAGAMLVGVVNAVGGGVLRSLLLHRTPQVFRPGQLTALAALGGTLAYAALSAGLHLDENVAGLTAIVLVAVTNWASRRYRLETRAAWSLQTRRRRDSRASRANG